jgi:hypothetical protein
VSELTGDNLAAFIAKRHACLTQLHRLGMKQRELVQSGELNSLMRLLSVKNQLLAALQTIEQSLAPFHQQEPEERVWSDPALRQACARQAEECQRMLAEIMHMERENEREITERRDLLATQLQTAQSATTARRAYQMNQNPVQGPHVPFPTQGSHTTGLDLHSQM